MNILWLACLPFVYTGVMSAAFGTIGAFGGLGSGTRRLESVCLGYGCAALSALPLWCAWVLL